MLFLLGTIKRRNAALLFLLGSRIAVAQIFYPTNDPEMDKRKWLSLGQPQILVNGPPLQTTLGGVLWPMIVETKNFFATYSDRDPTELLITGGSELDHHKDPPGAPSHITGFKLDLWISNLFDTNSAPISKFVFNNASPGSCRFDSASLHAPQWTTPSIVFAMEYPTVDPPKNPCVPSTLVQSSSHLHWDLLSSYSGLTVDPQPPNALTIQVGTIASLSPIARDGGGQILNMAPWMFDYNIPDDPYGLIASVDALGVVMGRGVGTVPVVVSEGKFWQKVYVTVLGGHNPPPPPPPPPIIMKTPPITPVASLDPNFISGPAGIGSIMYVSGVSPAGYVISFGNDETATAPAQEVVITDHVDPGTFDLRSLTLGPIIFPGPGAVPAAAPLEGLGGFSTQVDLRPDTNLLLNVTASLNSVTGLLTWTFQSIDPDTGQPPTDPTVGFLGPGQTGSVSFTARALSTLLTGAVLSDAAAIVFDQNSPLATPGWSNQLDVDSPLSRVMNLTSTQNTSCFPVQWNGTDIGSGLKSFAVYVSDNGGSYAPWLNGSTVTKATFTGQAGHSYSFYSVATDLVGNVELSKTTPEATTTIGPNASCNGRPTISGSVVSHSLTGTTEKITLQFTNSGIGNAPTASVSQVSFRTLAGSGTVTVAAPLVPIQLGSLPAGASTTVPLTLNLPSTVKEFSIIEQGTIQDVNGSVYSFSIAQTVLP